MQEISLYYLLGSIIVLTGIYIVRFSSNILRIILFAYWYPLLPMFLFCIGIPLGGSLDVIGRPTHNENSLQATLLAVLSLIIVLFILRKNLNFKFQIKHLPLSEGFRSFLVFCLFIVAMIAYPKAWGLSESRWNLLPGQWSVVYLSLNGLLILSLRSWKSFSVISHLAVLLFVLKGGERVDSIMVIFFIMLLKYNNEGKVLEEVELSFGKKALGLLILVFGISIGYNRVGNVFSFGILLHNIIAMHTVTDVIHVYFTSFDYLTRNGLNWYPVVNEIFSIVPTHPWGGAGVDFNFTEILRKHLYNYGGGLFYTEGVLIFGRVGVLVYGALFGFFIKKTFTSTTSFGQVVAVLFFILQLRCQWYGSMYLYTPVIFTSLLFYLIWLINFQAKEV